MKKYKDLIEKQSQLKEKFILVYVLTLSLFFCQGQEKKETIEYPNNKLKEIDSAINLGK